MEEQVTGSADAAPVGEELAGEQLEGVAGGYTLIELLPLRGHHEKTRSTPKLQEAAAKGTF